MLCSFVWGSTWFAITWQLGDVDPLWSICYRFMLASGFTGLICCFRRKLECYNLVQHLRLMAQGSCLCGLSYWLVYLSEMYITSALSALISTTVLYMNVIFGRVLFGNAIRVPVVIGGIMGSVGIGMIFLPELIGSKHPDFIRGAVMAFAGCVFFSLGSLACERNEKDGMGLLPVAMYSMFYGGLLVALIAVFQGISPTFEPSTKYIVSLLYLACFGSVIAMTSYMALIRRIGADRTAYVDIVFPVIALLISTLFEGYQWTLAGMAGVPVILLGNLIAIDVFSRTKAF